MNAEMQAAGAGRDPEFLYEFDREAIPESRLLGPGHFAGAYAGEHVAATEFVIGVTFVNWGASVQDIFLGLVIGNLLAVLTWTLVCAPIAVETRLTLYWYLRKIGGPRLTSIYNVINAFLYSIMAGCMITVSASAVRIPFGIPPQLNWYPTDFRFVLVVLGVGAVVVTLAVLGFKKLATFASVCSPWMFLMFVVGAVAVLPELFASAGGGGFFEMAHQSVWTGQTPDGSEPMGFWKVAAFAWICNLGMHGALSDMALFRFAKKSSYGLYSSFGMFLGHYLAWICAGLMGAGAALLMGRSLVELDAGEIGYQALGWVGALAVVIAGWTTSNPTLYRVGLALQAVTPNWSRAKVTLVAGIATTAVACFPFVFTGLLDYVALYGLLISPIGAIVVTEHWIFPRTGLNRYWATRKGLSLNWAAVLTWGLSVALAVALERGGLLHLFYLFLPVYAFAMVAYWILAKAMGAAEPGSAEELPAVGDEPESRGSAPSVGPGNTASMLISGSVAALALVSCLWLGYSVLAASPENYGSALSELHSRLTIPTLIYFVAGTVFFTVREKRKEGVGLGS
jgi:NCS1 family nucleobase:cation symporter-1